MAFVFFRETLNIKCSRSSWFHETFAKQIKFLWFKANLQIIIEPMNLRHSLAVIYSQNERKMPDAVSPSQIHILFGVREAKKKPIRTIKLKSNPLSLLAGRLPSTDDSILGQIFRMKVKISPPERFWLFYYLGLWGRAPPRYVSSVRVQTVSKLRAHK